MEGDWRTFNKDMCILGRQMLRETIWNVSFCHMNFYTLSEKRGCFSCFFVVSITALTSLQ